MIRVEVLDAFGSATNHKQLECFTEQNLPDEVFNFNIIT